jgi:hypothetical protein
VKRRAGAGHETPRLIVMTESVWQRMSGGHERRSQPMAHDAVAAGEPERLPVARPIPNSVAQAVRSLESAHKRVKVPMIVRELRHRTGCSRAGAYRAIADAFAAGEIRRT